MANPYFNFFNQNTNEFNLYNNLADEIVEQWGMPAYYMPRQNRKDDYLFGDAVGSYFTAENSFEITLYLENPLDFTNDENYSSKFGLQVNNQANFIVQQQRIHQAIGNKPYTGDLIYTPMLGNRVWELSKGEEKNTLYMFGQLMTYKLVCNLLELSDETFDTPYSELNSLNSMTSISSSHSDNISATTATVHISFDERFPFGD
jgi:hypothetical protein